MIASVALSLLAAAAVPAAGPADTPLAGAEPHVRVTATIVVLDHEAVRRAGVSSLAVGDGRIRVEAGRRAPRSVRAGTGHAGLRVDAFLDLVRRHRWVRSESTQDLLVLSGGEGHLSSSNVTIGGFGARATGPELSVAPTALADGRVHLRVTARMADVGTDRWGNPVDGSPVSAATEVVVEDGREAVLASGTVAESVRDAGLLFRGSSERERDVLVVLTPRVER